MSAATEADEKQQAAQKGVQQALEAVGKILTRSVDGATDYTSEWDEKLQQTFNDLLNIQRRHGW